MRTPLYAFSQDHGPDTLDDVTPLPGGVPISHIPQPELFETLLNEKSSPAEAFTTWAERLIGGYEHVWTLYPPEHDTRYECRRCSRWLPPDAYHIDTRPHESVDGRGLDCRYCRSDYRTADTCGQPNFAFPLEARELIVQLRAVGWPYYKIADEVEDIFGKRPSDSMMIANFQRHGKALRQVVENAERMCAA